MNMLCTGCGISFELSRIQRYFIKTGRNKGTSFCTKDCWYLYLRDYRLALGDRSNKSYRKGFNSEHEHRIVMETKLGRKLEQGEVVHHVNGKIRDNRPENLAVMSRGEHVRLHLEGTKR